MRESKLSIILISMDSGFQSLNYYSEIFKKIIGVNPSSYRKFCHYRLDHATSDMVRNNLGKIMQFMDFVSDYKKKRAVKKLPVKVRSIFR